MSKVENQIENSPDVNSNRNLNIRFTDARIRKSSLSVYNALRIFITVDHKDLDLDWRFVRKQLYPKIKFVSARYWAHIDNNEYRYTGIKKDVKRLRSQLKRLTCLIDSLPRNNVSLINGIKSRNKDGKIVDHICVLRNSSEELIQACTEVKHLKFEKSVRISIQNVCYSLWMMWERIIGRPFIRSWAITKTKDKLVLGRGTHEFVSLDALFVQIALRAIDPRIGAKQVRTGLKRVAKAIPKSG